MSMSYYNIDNLRESMVKILGSDGQSVSGSGFIIRADGYLITCHHVIYLLDALKVEYQGQRYDSEWCEELSNPEVDIAVLKIDVEDAKAVTIINPQDLSTSVTVYGFPPSQRKYFPEGFDVSAQKIRPSAPIKALLTSSLRQINFNNPWNKLPKDESVLLSYRIDVKVDPGTSGGAVFAEDLGGVVGIIKSSDKNESYVIRWDNITEYLDKLGLEPEKNAVCQFLQEIEDKFNTIIFFHIKEKKISLKEQYIPIQVTIETKRRDGKSFFGYAETEEEGRRAYALKRFEESQQSQVDWKEANKQYQNQNILVLADPGMGKSTLLKMEAGTTAKQEREKLKPLPNPPLQGEGVRQLPPVSGGLRGVEDVIFPLFLRLSELVETAEEIIDAITLLFKREYPKTYPGIEHLFKDKISQGKCLLLLDALDEVPKDHRNRLKDKLNRFIRNYPCPIIGTSRIVGYGGAFVEGAKEVEIVPFSQKQTEEYIEIWFKNAENYIEDESVSAEGLIQELRNKPQIGGLAQNPLLLSLLCSLYQEKGLTLPARRTQVYQKAVDYMLNKWSANRKHQSSGKIEAKVRLLEKLAYDFSCDDQKDGSEIFNLSELHDAIEKYHRNNQLPDDFRNSTPSELIEELSEEDGILQKWDRDGDKYLFLHRTFQEYLTASYLNRTIKGNQNEGISLVKKLFWEYDSHETLILLAGLMDKPVLLLEAITKEEDDIFKTLLLLAGRCLAECQEYGKSRLDSTNPFIAKIIQRIYKLWRRYPNATFIQSTLVALGQVNAQMYQKVQAALNDSDSDVRIQAAEALGYIGNAQAVEALIAAFNDSDSFVRGYAAVALGKMGNAQTMEALIAVLNHSDSDVRWHAAVALGKMGNVQAVEALIAALNHSDSDVRIQAAEALGKMGNVQAVEALIAALYHSDIDVRIQAAVALGKMGNAQAVGTLIAALYHPGRFVRTETAVALGEIGNAQAVEALIAALNHSNSDVRIQTAMALGEIGNAQAVEALIAILNYSDSFVRIQAAGALSKIGNAQAVEALIAALNHSNSFVRIQAAGALSKIGNAQGLEVLIAALNHSDSFVRIQAAEALSKIGNAQAVEALIAALNDSDSDVRIQAAEALSKIGNAQAVQALITALNDSDSDVRWQAAQALGEIGNPKTLKNLIEFWTIDLYHRDIFPEARKLAVRFSKEKQPFIPVYPKFVRFKYSPLLTTVTQCYKHWLGQKIRERRSKG